MKFAPCSHAVVLLLTFLVPTALAAPATQLCARPGPVISKFFVLSDLLFVSNSADHFDTFRVLNLSSGVTSMEYKVAGLLPTGAANTLLWAFLYDPLGAKCRVKIPGPVRFDPDRYCARMINLRGIVVARLSNQAVLFLRPNNGKFMEVADANNFLEMHALLKHLDKYGLASSLTFAQESNIFVSTHYGRHGQICLTTARHQGKYVMPLPLMEDMLSDSLFATECLLTVQSYTSVVDVHGALFAVTSAGTVDRIQFKDRIFRAVQSFSDKTFLNCGGRSPAIMKGHYDHDVDLVLANNFQANNAHAQAGIKVRSMEEQEELMLGAESKATGSGGSWKYLLVFFLASVVAFVGYMVYTGEIDGNYWAQMARDRATLVTNSVRQSAANFSKKPASKKNRKKKAVVRKEDASVSSNCSDRMSSRQFSGVNLSQWVASKTAGAPSISAGTSESDTSQGEDTDKDGGGKHKQSTGQLKK